MSPYLLTNNELVDLFYEVIGEMKERGMTASINVIPETICRKPLSLDLDEIMIDFYYETDEPQDDPEDEAEDEFEPGRIYWDEMAANP